MGRTEQIIGYCFRILTKMVVDDGDEAVVDGADVMDDDMDVDDVVVRSAYCAWCEGQVPLADNEEGPGDGDEADWYCRGCADPTNPYGFCTGT